MSIEGFHVRDVTISLCNAGGHFGVQVADTNVCKLCSFVLDLTLARLTLQRVLSVVYC